MKPRNRYLGGATGTAGGAPGAPGGAAVGLIVMPRLRNSSTTNFAFGLPLSASSWVSRATLSSLARNWVAPSTAPTLKKERLVELATLYRQLPALEAKPDHHSGPQQSHRPEERRVRTRSCRVGPAASSVPRIGSGARRCAAARRGGLGVRLRWLRGRRGARHGNYFFTAPAGCNGGELFRVKVMPTPCRTALSCSSPLRADSSASARTISLNKFSS